MSRVKLKCVPRGSLLFSVPTKCGVKVVPTTGNEIPASNKQARASRQSTAMATSPRETLISLSYCCDESRKHHLLADWCFEEHQSMLPAS
jgi:hypothetical protein